MGCGGCGQWYRWWVAEGAWGRVWICEGFLRSGGWILGRGCLGKFLKGSGGMF